MLNLTPHAIRICRPDGSIIEVPPSGAIARVATIEAPKGAYYGVPVITRSLGAVTGLPESGPVLVSSMVLEALRAEALNGRDLDGLLVFAPDTGPTALRLPNGQVDAVTRLVSL